MVHHRLNERETRPNKHINFITALPAPGTPEPFSEEDARQLLRALAAQVRPIMKNHGFEVNSFEEYEYNRVFAGRNWNAGEVIEIVLRRPDGTFASTPWLLSTLCHELAHIKHMNHGRDFQKLWSQLRVEVKALQERGYYGDGYWSSGTRISDSYRVGGQGIEDFDLPEYICGGAQVRMRVRSLGRRRYIQRRAAGPSTSTGAQTAKRRKPGTRVQAKSAFKGEGRALNDDISDEEAKIKGAGFRKQAGSKRAREERALAAEKRLKLTPGQLLSTSPAQETDEDTSDEEDLSLLETDEDRKRLMRDSMDEGEFNHSQQFMKDYLSSSNEKGSNFDKSKLSGLFEAIEISDDEKDDFSSRASPSSSRPKLDVQEERPTTTDKKSVAKYARAETSLGTPASSSKSLGPGRIVQEEMKSRKREALGLDSARKLGSSKCLIDTLSEAKEPTRVHHVSDSEDCLWACLVCTLLNKPEHLACSACSTPRGESFYPH